MSFSPEQHVSLRPTVAGKYHAIAAAVAVLNRAVAVVRVTVSSYMCN